VEYEEDKKRRFLQGLRAQDAESITGCGQKNPKGELYSQQRAQNSQKSLVSGKHRQDVVG
jgi:hypothetical protein